MMKHTNSIFSFRLQVLVAGICLALNVQAGDSPKHGPATYSDFDLDSNGQVSEEEFNSVRAKRMAARAAEGGKMKGASTAPSFADIDTDGDGQINPEELTAAQKTHMAKRHGMAQGDGHGKGDCKGECKGHGQGYGKGHGMGHGKGHGKGQGDMTQKTGKPRTGMTSKMPAFSDFDTDGNGKIEEAEFNKAHAERMAKMAAEGHSMKHAADAPGFSGIDTDGNGEISPGEFQQHQSEHHHMHHGKQNQKDAEKDSAS